MRLDSSQNISRVIAVAALVVAVIAVIAVAGGSLGEDGEDRGRGAEQTERSEREQPQQRTKAKRYEVAEGDTLTSISVETGVPVEEILRLNPDVDPQTLNAGEKLKLR